MSTLPSAKEARKKLNEKIKELETSIEKYVEDAEAYNRDWDDDGVPEVDKNTLDEMISRLERLKTIGGGTRRRKRNRKRKTRKRKKNKSKKKRKKRRRRTRK